MDSGVLSSTIFGLSSIRRPLPLRSGINVDEGASSVVVVVVVVDLVVTSGSSVGVLIVVVVGGSVTTLKRFLRAGLIRWKGAKPFPVDGRAGCTTAAGGDANGAGSGTAVNPGGGGVLVMVTVVLSGVTMVKVIGFGGELASASFAFTLLVNTAGADCGVVVTHKRDSVELTGRVVGSGVVDGKISDRMAVTGSNVVVDLKGAGLKILAAVPPPDLNDSKLLTILASEMVSGSSTSSSGSGSVVVSGSGVVLVMKELTVLGPRAKSPGVESCCGSG